jgi:hypothetical protein
MAPTPCISAGRPSARATTPAMPSPTSGASRPTRTASTPRVFVTLNTIFRDDELDKARKARLAGVRGRRRRADRAGHGPAGAGPAADPVACLDAVRHPHAGKGEVPRRCRLFADGAGARTLAAGDRRHTRKSYAKRYPGGRCWSYADGSTHPRILHPRRALRGVYSGQCYISHAHTGRSANRGECSQACRLPYNLEDSQGRIVAFDKHLLSMKDNDQSANLRALADAGIRSFKIEGRLKDMAYVKNATAHYRQLMDRILDDAPEYARASSGRCSLQLHAAPGKDLQPRRHRLLRQWPPARHRRLRHAQVSPAPPAAP